jgi:hypothetical protein
MNPWTTAGLFVGELAVIALLFLAFHRRGYTKGEKAGFQRGYQEGHLTADQWWLSRDFEVREAKQKIQDEERWP